MKRLIYILIAFLAVMPLSDICFAKDNTDDGDETRKKISMPHDWVPQVLVYYRMAPPMVFFQNLILKPYQETYELYNQIMGSEIGSYKINNDTLYLIPRFNFDYSKYEDYWNIANTISGTESFTIETPKELLIKDKGALLLDLTYYNELNTTFNKVYPQQSDDEYILLK